jgi:hypothetical protein
MEPVPNNKIFDASKILLPSRAFENVSKSIQLEKSPQRAGLYSDGEPLEDTLDRSLDHNFVKIQRKKRKAGARGKHAPAINTNTDLDDFLAKTSAFPLQIQVEILKEQMFLTN